MANGEGAPEWRVLDFFCDDDGSCALTVLVRGFRFHVIANKGNLSSTPIGQRYDDLVEKLQADQSVEVASTASSDNHTETDSGIDITNQDRSTKNKKVRPGEALQRFMLEPLSEEFENLSESKEEETLQEWYHGPTYFYSLELDTDKALAATQLEATPDLTKRMEKLRPEMALPKQLTDRFDIPFYQASDLIVVATSDQPPGTPFHPCRVRHDQSKRTSFLKIVDNSQPQPVKRELDLLYRAMELKVNSKINVPSLEGLVMFDGAEETKSGQKRIMGFLQTDIPEAKSLTSVLDSSVDQSKRERWAEEVEHAKEVLHEHDIIWGDAKADNFIVDNDDKLWIIDFGGSYTEGWVDPDKKETIEGDDMGTERIMNALEDPVANTYDPEDEGEDEAGGGGKEKPSVTFSPDRERKRRFEELESEGAESRPLPERKDKRNRRD